MTIAYFDCFSGIAGDMILGALIDVGVNETLLKKELQKLPLSGYELQTKKIQSNHISAIDVTINVTQDQHHRSLADITTLITHSTLPSEVKKLSQTIFNNLGKAEAKIHNIPIDDVHFHEVGAIDSIIDIVGSVIGIHLLGVDTIICSPLPLGHGFVSCDHGLLPLPAPATIELLKGVPVYSVDRNQETVTPTGAAVITTLATRFGEMPPMKITNIGYGSGKIPSKYPSLLRIYLGEPEEKTRKEKHKEKEKK